MSRAVALLLCVVYLTQLLQTTLSLADDECKCEVCSDVILRRDRVAKDTAGVIDKTTLRTQENYACAKVNLKVITSVALKQTVRGSSCTTGLTYRRDGVWVDLGCWADELRVCGIPHNADKDCIEFDGSWNCYSYAKPRESESCDPGCADDEFCNQDIRGLWSCKPRPIDPIHPDTLWSVNVTTMYCPLGNPDFCQHPGTTGKVWIKILGARKNTGWIELKPKSGEFEEGFTDEFHFKTPNIGGYRHIYIEHEAVEKDDVWGCKEVTVRKNLDKPLKFRCSWIHGVSRRLPFPGGPGVSRSGTVNMSTILRNFAMKHNCCWYNGVCGRCERSIKSQDAAALFDVDVDDHRGLWFGN